MTYEFLRIIKSTWHFILPIIICNIFAIYAVTKSVNMQQDSISYDLNILNSVPQPRFYEQSITYKK